MYNRFITILLLGMSLHLHAETRSCKEQVYDVKTKLSAAQAANNSFAEHRLRSALSYIEEYCNDTEQRRNAIRDVERKQLKLKKAEIDLQAAKDELLDAKENGKTSRINQKLMRIKSKEIRLEEAKDELDQAKNNLSKMDQ
ncbi:DUF1090 family protein [Serratia marcescens]|uniref:DUF1090 family protein n=1 Tax=Serratia marcescens TaxID=615 RepID=UPI0013DA4D1C|nr:DUF1090 family protein [Serratia marcescens]